MSELTASIQRNSLIHLSGKFISLALGLVTIGIMGRYLGDVGFGVYTTVVGFLQFFGILIDFGLTLTTSQMIAPANVNVNKIMSNIMTLRIISAVIVLGLAPIIVLFFPYPAIVKVGVLISTGSFFCTTLIQVLTNVFQKELKMVQITIAEVVGRAVLLGLTIAAATYLWSINAVFAAVTVGNVITLVLAWYYARKYVTIRPAFDGDVWKDIFQRTWPMALSISFNLLYLRMDIIFLSLYRSLSEVGWYGAAYRVVDILTMVPAAYVGIVLPHMTRAHTDKDEATLKHLMQTVFNTMVIGGMPILVGTMLIARPVMEMVAGPDFAVSGDILKVLIWATAMILMTSVFGYAIVAIGRQKDMMWAYGFTAMVTVAGYWYLIPIYGVWAAAWLTVASEAIVMVWSFVKTYQYTKFVPSFSIVWKSLIASAVMGVVVYFMRNTEVVMVLLVSCVVYFPVLRLVGGIRPGFVKNILKG